MCVHPAAPRTATAPPANAAIWLASSAVPVPARPMGSAAQANAVCLGRASPAPAARPTATAPPASAATRSRASAAPVPARLMGSAALASAACQAPASRAPAAPPTVTAPLASAALRRPESVAAVSAADGQCGSGRCCLAGTCIAGPCCASNGDYTAGQCATRRLASAAPALRPTSSAVREVLSVGHHRRPLLRHHGDCTAGQCCESATRRCGACACTADSQCGAGKCCVGGACSAGPCCTTNGDCTAGQCYDPRASADPARVRRAPRVEQERSVVCVEGRRWAARSAGAPEPGHFFFAATALQLGPSAGFALCP